MLLKTHICIDICITRHNIVRAPLNCLLYAYKHASYARSVHPNSTMTVHVYTYLLREAPAVDANTALVEDHVHQQVGVSALLALVCVCVLWNDDC